MPKVRFDSLEVKDLSFQRADVDFVFSVDNPNPVEIGLSSFEYNLGFEQVDFLSGSDEDGFALEAVGSSELRLPVGFEWTTAYETFQATRGEDYIDFALDGTFGFETPIGEALVPYDESGAFPGIRTPKFQFDTVRVKRIDAWSGTADIELDLGVDNEHGSDIGFRNFDYDLKMGGNPVARGVIEDFGVVPGATTGTMTIPATVDLVEAGSTVWDALAGTGNLRTQVTATSDVDTPFGSLPLSLDETGDVTVEQDP